MAKLSTTHMRITVFLAIVAGVLLLRHYAGQSSDVSQEVPRRTVEITYNFTVAGIPEAAERVRIWAPVPPSNDDQQLHDVNLAGDWPHRIVEEPGFGNRLLVIDVNNASLSGSREAAFSIRYRVTRYAIHPERGPASGRRVAQDEPTRYLAANRLIPIDGSIATEARRIAGDQQDRLKQARMLYDNIVSTVRYDKSGAGWGRGDAVYACDVRQGNCTDFHSLFIGQARALGIPARFIMGLPLPEGQTEGPIPGYHCWGQFYLAECGWCPVDASEASKSPQKRDQFFCGLDQHRVAFTTGRDIKLPGTTAGPLNYVIYPHVEIDGRPHDSIETAFSFADVGAGS